MNGELTEFHTHLSNTVAPLQSTPTFITFNQAGVEVGHLEVKDGVMSFHGNVEESAKVFFDCVVGQLNEYIKNRV